MTCVIGLIRNGQVWLGADSLYLTGWHISRSPNPKIFRVGGMLIGTSGSQRVSDILQYNLEVDEGWDEPIDCITQSFIPEARKALKEHGGMTGDKIEDSCIMVAYGGHLFIIGEDFSLSEISTYDAIGAGAKYALGYIYAMEKTSLLPMELLTDALECAAWFCAGCAGPMVVEKA